MERLFASNCKGISHWDDICILDEHPIYGSIFSDLKTFCVQHLEMGVPGSQSSPGIGLLFVGNYCVCLEDSEMHEEKETG